MLKIRADLNWRNYMQVFHKAWVQGMTIANVTLCFRAAEVYPVNKSAVMSQIDTSRSPSHCTGAPYAPQAEVELHNPHQHLLIRPRLLCYIMLVTMDGFKE